MIWLAIAATIGTILWTVIALYANSMRSSPGKLEGGGLLGFLWAVVVILWLIVFL